MQSWIHHLYLLLLTCAAGLALISVGFALRMRETPGAKLLALLMSGVTVWCIGCVMEMLSNTISGKMLACQVQYLGIATTPLTWFLFIMQYLQRDSWLSRRWQLFLWLIPIATILMIWTNGLHHLMYADYTLDLNGLPPYWRITYGPWFWVHLSNSWLLVATALVLITLSVRQMAPFYRRQASILVMIALVPLIVNIIYVLRLGPLKWFDLTPIAFAVSGASLLVALRYFHLIDLSPIARNAIFESMNDGVIVLDSRRRIIDTNPAVRAVLGRAMHEMFGSEAETLFADWLPASVFQPSGGVDIVQIARDSEPERWFDLRASMLPRGRGWLLVLHDITDRHLLQERLNAMAYYDYLTGLPNRALANDHLQKELARARRRQTRVAVLYLDVDGFKAVNDTLGHAVGDHLLQVIAERLRTCIRESDTAARMGGDEFIIIVSDLSMPDAATISAERILATFATPIALGGNTIAITVSIGIAGTMDDAIDAEQLIRRADDAMYQAKARGKNTYAMYQNSDPPPLAPRS